MNRYDIVIRLDRFGESDDFADDVAAMVECLTHINVNFLERHPEFPLLYESGVRYVQRLHSRCRLELWKNAPAVLRDRGGDCKDLVAWRIAELQVRYGIVTTVRVTWSEAKNGRVDMHITLVYPDGTIEDPSIELGMRPALAYGT